MGLMAAAVNDVSPYGSCFCMSFALKLYALLCCAIRVNKTLTFMNYNCKHDVGHSCRGVCHKFNLLAEQAPGLSTVVAQPQHEVVSE